MIAPHPMIAAAAFGSSWMLAWAVAALAPVVLHWWRNRRYQQTSWAAMTFLMAALEQQSRQWRLEQVMLLLLRMAIPIVLALALADPVWRTLPAWGSAGNRRGSQHHLFVVDTSYSMGYRADGESCLDRAKQLARDIIRESARGDGFTLIVMAEPPRAVVAVPVFSREGILAQMEALSLNDTQANLHASLDLVRGTLRDVGQRYPHVARHRVYLLSDFRANTWEDAQRAATRQLAQDIGQLAEITALDVGVADPVNAGIAAVERDSPLITTGQTVTWRVRVHQFVGSTGGDRAVEFHLDGKLMDRQPVPPTDSQQESATVFQHRFTAAGPHIVSFRLRDDPLEADNRFFEVLTVRDAARVLCVEGAPGAARFVEHALSPNQDSPIATTTVADYRMDEVNAERFDCIFFCNVAGFSETQAAQLGALVQSGRSLVFFLGDRVDGDVYNHTLGEASRQLLPARILDRAAAGTYAFAPAEYEHPIIAPFRGQESAGLLTTPIWCYTRLAPTPSAQPVLNFDNGDAAIIERPSRGGTVVLIATPAADRSSFPAEGKTSAWNAWTSWPSFLPIVQELVRYAVGRQDRHGNLRVGESVDETISPLSDDEVVDIRHDESGQQWRAAVVRGHGPPAWNFGETFWTGVYTASMIRSGGTRSFAVNLVANDESQLAPFPLRSLPEAFRGATGATNTGGTASAAVDEARPLFRWLLGIAAALLVCESWTAAQLGKSRS